MKRKESPARYIKMIRKKSTNRKRDPPVPASNESTSIMKCEECGVHIDSDQIERHRCSRLHKRNFKQKSRDYNQGNPNIDLIKKKKM